MQVRQNVQVIDIGDLDNLSEEKKIMLCQALHEHAASNNPYLLLKVADKTHAEPPDALQLTTVYELVGRQSQSNPDHYHFDRYLDEAVDKGYRTSDESSYHYTNDNVSHFSEGAFGEIKPIVDTFNISFKDKTFLTRNNNTQRIGKWMQVKDFHCSFGSSILPEFHLTKRNIELGAKPPSNIVALNQKRYGVMVLNYLPDIDLFPNDKFPAQAAVIEEQQIRKIIALLLGYRRVFASRIVHSDIKGSNIRLQGGKFFQATFFDYGLSHSQERPSALTRGTPLFSAPEFFKAWPEESNPIYESITSKSDIFTLVWMIGGLLNADAPCSIKAKEAIEVAHNLMNTIEKTLFKGLTFSEKHKASMRAVLAEMSRENPENRPADVTEALNVFESILLSLLIQKTESDFHHHIKTIFAAGINLREHLHVWARKYFVEDLLGFTPEEVKEFSAGILEFEKNLGRINYQPYLPILFERINSTLLRDSLTTHALPEVIAMTLKLIEAMKDNLAHAQALGMTISVVLEKVRLLKDMTEQEKTAQTALREIQKHLQLLHPKTTYALTLDNINYLNNRLKKRFIFLDAAYKEAVQRLERTKQVKLRLPFEPGSSALSFSSPTVSLAKHNNTTFGRHPHQQKRKAPSFSQKGVVTTGVSLSHSQEVKSLGKGK